ncbi:hypothetical protein [Microcystis aeruginosa]|jgi:uncharacterized protein YjbI with pentapeptide repeats|uniref:hypothetical protein n=1 Tax=Microcystis aeruginosa TaxID=1126 RepID=UPI0018EEF537|nr:hypothetical protein [Microcystis aeruginosa]
MKPTLLTAFCLLLITVFSCFHAAIAKAVTTTLTNTRLDGANLQDADGEGAIGVDPNLF